MSTPSINNSRMITRSQTHRYTNDLTVVQKMIKDLHVLIHKKGVTFVGGDEVRFRPKHGLPVGQFFIMIGIKDANDTVLKTYLRSNGILKKEGPDFWDIVMDGKKCPLYIRKNCVFEF